MNVLVNTFPISFQIEIKSTILCDHISLCRNLNFQKEQLMVLISQVDQYLNSFYKWEFIIWFVDVLSSLNEGTATSDIDSPVWGSFIHN